MEQGTPGSAEGVIGGFQDDFNEITLAVTALVQYAGIQRDSELLAKARGVLGDLTRLMRVFADIIYTKTRPDRLAERLFQAALFDAWGGLASTPVADLGELPVAEAHTAVIESWLAFPEPQPAALLTDEEIRARIEGELPRKSQTVQQRYTDAYGDTPPIRRTPDGYEARGVPEAEHPWKPVTPPRHQVFGGIHLLYALPLCETSPTILDCTWAALGCARPDLNADGTVDAADTSLFETARQAHAGKDCREKNGWCQGADLDRTGRVDEVDAAFMAAAQGCHT